MGIIYIYAAKYEKRIMLRSMLTMVSAEMY